MSKGVSEDVSEDVETQGVAKTRATADGALKTAAEVDDGSEGFSDFEEVDEESDGSDATDEEEEAAALCAFQSHRATSKGVSTKGGCREKGRSGGGGAAASSSSSRKGASDDAKTKTKAMATQSGKKSKAVPDRGTPAITSKESPPNGKAFSKKVGKARGSNASAGAKITSSDNVEAADANIPRKTTSKSKQSKATPRSDEDASVSEKVKTKRAKTAKAK